MSGADIISKDKGLSPKSEATSLETIGNIDDDINSAISPKSSPEKSPPGIMWPSQAQNT